MDEEIHTILNEVDKIEKQIDLMSKKRPDNDMEDAILDDEICQLEKKIDNYQIRLRDLYQLRDYQEQCNHVFVEDLIDITPDRSMVIRYCVHCEYSE